MTKLIPVAHMANNDAGIPGAIYERIKAQNIKIRGPKKTGTELATSLLICAGTSTGSYSGADLNTPAVRIGADDHQRLPSRYCDELRYRDGRVKTMRGQK